MGDSGSCGCGTGVERAVVGVVVVGSSGVVHIGGMSGVAGMMGAVVMLAGDLVDEGGGLVFDGLHGRGLCGCGGCGVVVGGGGSWLGHVE